MGRFGRKKKRCGNDVNQNTHMKFSKNKDIEYVTISETRNLLHSNKNITA